jgi:hypothetical protein
MFFREDKAIEQQHAAAATTEQHYLSQSLQPEKRPDQCQLFLLREPPCSLLPNHTTAVMPPGGQTGHSTLKQQPTISASLLLLINTQLALLCS